MITDRTLASLRTAASLVLLTPGLSVSVEVGETRVVEASRDLGRPEGGSSIIPVCAFHRCVGKAHHLRRSGSQVEMVGISGDLEPTVTLECDDDVRMVPGGTVRRRANDTWIHLHALSLPVEQVEPAADRVCQETGVDLELHADRVTDVTVLVTYSPYRDRAAAHRAIDTIERVAAAATVDALVDLLDPQTDWDQMPELDTAVRPN